MDEQTAHTGGAPSPDYTKVLLSASFSTLAWLGGLIIVLCGVVGRLWLSGLESELSAIRTTASAEAAARIQLEVRTTQLENGQIEAREQRRQVAEQVRDLRQKVDRHQEDGHGRHR